MATWKAFERNVAALFGGRRFWANSGEQIDVEGPTTVAQCKLVSRMSLEALTQLAETAQRQGEVKQKAGVVAIKVRRGKGRPSPTLIVLTEDVWRWMNGGGAPEPVESSWLVTPEPHSRTHMGWRRRRPEPGAPA